MYMPVIVKLYMNIQILLMMICRRMSAMRSAMENISVPRQICTDFWKIIPAKTIENEKI